MNRHELANAIAPANLSFRSLAGKFQILRRQTNRNKREDVRFVTNPSAPINYTMPMDLHALTQYDLVANYRVRTDVTAISNLRLGTNDCRRMDLHWGFP